MIEVAIDHFEGIFDCIQHECECPGVPSSSINLYFVRHDSDGVSNWNGLIGLILGYITQYCFSAEKRAGLSEFERNQNYQKAKQLFRDDPKTGQPGEILIYLFIEAIMKAPQVLKKMPLTTNPKEERKGSDGMHLRMTDEGIVELIFAESKLYGSFKAALDRAFESMGEFYTSPTKALERSYFTKGFTEISPELQELVVSFIEGKNLEKSREVYACLIGFDWAEYGCLTDERRAAFVKEFKARYGTWAEDTLLGHLTDHVIKFPHKHLKLEFFFVPFPDVANFRKQFLGAL